MLNKPLQCRKTGINCTDFCSCSDSEELCEDLNGDGDDGYDDGDCNGDDDEEEEEDFTDQVAWEDSESKTKFVLDTLKHFFMSILLRWPFHSNRS